MLWKEITAGFLLAGLVAQLSNSFFTSLFVANAPRPVPALENVVVGPLIAVLSFVCSVGNVPLAAVLWSGGISFAGVLAFLFADLIVLPIVAIYRKYYGGAFTVRIVALMLVTMILAALFVDAVFSVLGLVPSGPRPNPRRRVRVGPGRLQAVPEPARARGVRGAHRAERPRRLGRRRTPTRTITR